MTDRTADRIPPPPPSRPPRGRSQIPAALGVFVVVLLSLQVFLLTVALDAWHVGDDRTTWITAGLSVLLAGGAAAFYRYLR